MMTTTLMQHQSQIWIRNMNLLPYFYTQYKSVNICAKINDLGPKYFYSVIAAVGWFYAAVLLIKIQLVDELLPFFKNYFYL